MDSRIQQDGMKMEEIMTPYSGKEGAHFGFICKAPNERYFCLGGRADLYGMAISEALARLIMITPGLDENYIGMVANSAVLFLQMMREKEKNEKPQ